MSSVRFPCAALCGLLPAGSVLAAGGEQPVNVTAVAMFALFVLLTLGISYWVAGRTRSTADF